MNKRIALIFTICCAAVTLLMPINQALAEELKMTGTITKIELAADGKSAIAVVKDNKTETSITLTITDDLTLDKFKDKRIVEGDEIRTKYEKNGDVNSSKMFKKTAGC